MSRPFLLWVSLSDDSSEPPLIVYFEYSYVGMSLFAFVAIPIPPVTRRTAEAMKKFFRPVLLRALSMQRYMNNPRIYANMTIAR